MTSDQPEFNLSYEHNSNFLVKEEAVWNKHINKEKYVFPPAQLWQNPTLHLQVYGFNNLSKNGICTVKKPHKLLNKFHTENQNG
jgi:hypothetical protein